MLHFARISLEPEKFFLFTGLTIEQFTVLSEKIKPLWEQAEKARLSGRDRKNVPGQGGKYKLATLEDKLLLFSVSSRFRLTDKLSGDIFGLNASNVCRLKKKLASLVEKATGPPLQESIHQGISPESKKISTFEELLLVCPEFARFIIDAAEERLQRLARRIQKKYYSGKEETPREKNSGR
ncbi:MAG: hypothetical protein NG747_04780 [Candidatus Brocadia sp.]|nr:hypothetical protein [Candidatus Brocadia sp.]